MPSFYDYAPSELRELPFNSRRSHLYPLNLPTASQAIEDQVAGRRADAYLPGKMGYSGRWNKGPAAVDYASNVVGVLSAAEASQTFVNSVVGPIEAGIGIYTPGMASADMVRLPQVRDNVYMEQNPITPGLLQRPIVQAPGLNAYAMTAAQPNSVQPDVSSQTLLSVAQNPDLAPTMSSLGLGRVRRRRMRTLRGLGGLGAAADAAAPGSTTPPALVYGYAALGTAGLGLGLYHGWKRTHSTGWTVVWGFASMWFPVIALPVMFIQGFGKKG